MSSREVAILLVHEGNSPKSQWPLAKSAIIIGREVESDIQIDDRQVSRRHAEITRTKQGYMLRDLASKNGTFLNGEAVSQEPRLIRNGDSIGIALCGKLTFVEEDATAPIISGQPQKPSIRMELAAKRVWVAGTEIAPPLSLAQYNLLELLYKNTGHVISRDKVVETVWSDEEAEGVSEQAIDALARRLRERIAEIDPENKYIETVRGHGCRLNLTDEP
ncbi:MAG: FHA domain-containing protein, partial [Planctomycetes bacterium]|nr:FHA domain-containing protein [Planctomycetota bacterium]